MRALARRFLALLLALSFAAPGLSLAQEAPLPPPAPDTGVAPAAAAAETAAQAPRSASLVGGFRGWAKLTNEWPGLDCRYESAPDKETVRLAFSEETGRLRGSIAIDIDAAAGSGCPPLRKRYSVDEATTSAGSVAFTDSGGNEWTLSLRRQGEILQGLLGWRQGGEDQPLADGFKGPKGDRPLARLNGEVRLRRVDENAEAAAKASKAGAPKKTSLGTHARHVGIVLGANVVALGLFYGANALGKGGSAGATTCSPRVCRVPLPGAACQCGAMDPTSGQPNLQNPSQVSGVPCPQDNSGRLEGQTCDGIGAPCQANLSCNIEGSETRCESPAGRCPF